MLYILAAAVVCILLLQATGLIPPSSVGGPMTIAAVVFAGALAVAIHEAWTRKRGVLGWLVNIVASFVGAFVAAPVGGMAMAMVLGPFMGGGGSLAASGGPLLYIALAGVMIATLLGSWGALWCANRFR